MVIGKIEREAEEERTGQRLGAGEEEGGTQGGQVGRRGDAQAGVWCRESLLEIGESK